MTDAFRDRIAQGETLDKILNDAFAVAREAPGSTSRRCR